MLKMTYARMAARLAAIFTDPEARAERAALEHRLYSRAPRPRWCLPKAGRLACPDARRDSPARHWHPRRLRARYQEVVKRVEAQKEDAGR
jgi:hypothetical protein